MDKSTRKVERIPIDPKDFRGALRVLATGELRWTPRQWRQPILDAAVPEVMRRLAAWGWSKGELARQLGVTSTIVCRVLNGTHSATGVWQGIEKLIEDVERSGGRPPDRVIDKRRAAIAQAAAEREAS